VQGRISRSFSRFSKHGTKQSPKRAKKIALLLKFKLDTYRILQQIINSTISNQASIQKVR